MRATNRKRALLISSSVILLCLTVIVGMTWALFTDTQTVKNHLQAGDLDITLTRTTLTKTTLDEKGYLKTYGPDNFPKNVDFSGDDAGNVFEIEMDDNGEITEKIVPGTQYIANMKLTNKSDVAFGYWIEIKCNSADAAKALAKQVTVTVTGDSGKPVSVSGGLIVGDEENFIDEVGIGDEKSFTVTVTFEDMDFVFEDGKLYSTNDAAENQDLGFDLIVYAVQVSK